MATARTSPEGGHRLRTLRGGVCVVETPPPPRRLFTDVFLMLPVSPCSVSVLRPNKCVLKLLILLITFLQMCFPGIKIILARCDSAFILCCAEGPFVGDVGDVTMCSHASVIEAALWGEWLSQAVAEACLHREQLWGRSLDPVPGGRAGGVQSQSCREGGCVSRTHRTSCCSRRNDFQPCGLWPPDTVDRLMHLINTLCLKQRAWVQLSATKKV